MASRKESANWKCPQISSLQILLTEGAARPHPVPSPPPWLPHPHFPQGLCKRQLFLFLLSLFTSMGSTGKRLRTCPYPGYCSSWLQIPQSKPELSRKHLRGGMASVVCEVPNSQFTQVQSVVLNCPEF